MAERVQKVLSQWGIASRRKAEKMIILGRVKINGQIAKLGDRVDLTQDMLQVDGKEVQQAHRPQLLYLLLHKPIGVVSTCDDPQKRPTVIDLLPQDLSQNTGIHPVGRLDFASSGALILTNDGELTLGLTHPRYHLPKTYLVGLNRPLTNQDLTCWREGVMLDRQKTLPATINLVKSRRCPPNEFGGLLAPHSWVYAPSDRTGATLEIVLTEGKNRQIRRVAQQLGYEVTKLHRVAIGSITLDISNNLKLPQGKYRHLKKTEINLLKASCQPKLLKLSPKPGSAVYD